MVVARNLRSRIFVTVIKLCPFVDVLTLENRNVHANSCRRSAVVASGSTGSKGVSIVLLGSSPYLHRGSLSFDAV